MAEAEKGGVSLEKGPGDLGEKPQIAKFRGDDGTSDSDKHKGEETKDVHYDR